MRLFVVVLIRQLFGEKWEVLISMVGLLVAMGSAPPMLAVVYGGLSLALFVSLAAYILKTGRELREKHIPVLIVVGRKDDELASMTDLVWKTMERWGFDAKKYDVQYDIERDDLMVRRELDLPLEAVRWAELTHKFEDRLIRLSRQLKGHKVFHIFLNCPAALAMGLGAIAGTRYSLVVYHYFQRDDRPYEAVFNFFHLTQKTGIGAQVVKSNVAEPFRYIEVLPPQTSGPRLFVSLHLASASHDPRGRVEQLAQEQGAVAAHIRNAYSGVLGPEEDWLRAAREVVTALSAWIAEPQTQQVDLFLNSPLPLAFAIGMALGIQSPVTVHHWFAKQEMYRPVLQLNQIKQRR
jgi:hypothetical protein